MDYYVNEFCSLVPWEKRTYYFVGGHVFFDYDSFYDKFSQWYEGVNPGHKNLGKVYARLPKPQGIRNLVTKTF